jgi:hypothetical protein
VRILDLSKGPVMIDSPGLYLLHRSWSLPEPEPGATLISISADEVVLDLQGFTIDYGSEGSTLISILGDDVTVRNGRLLGSAGAAIHGRSERTTIERIEAAAHLGIVLGEHATMRDSSVSAYYGTSVGTGSIIERSRFGGSVYWPLQLHSDSVVSDCLFDVAHYPGIYVAGEGNRVARNTLLIDAGVESSMHVAGDRNVIRDNTARIRGSMGTILLVDGGGNTIDGNIAAAASAGAVARTGIEFAADGNYFGDNRMAAATPFDLGATTQTDWGGNVGY